MYLEDKGEHRHEDWINLETIKKNQKLQGNLKECHPQISTCKT